ncbi:transporter substrate-binding domain-containing protein [Ectothiorhodospiraceae bacterium WFHF3C12]|nr:transporter substrate-binding domain-containing protein [Ectothiorhodospiraceae bacterium WFHF3C12]
MSGKAPWRVGVLFSQTGVTAVIERSQLNGTLLAIEEINEAGGVQGREIEPIICDPASDLTLYGQQAEWLLRQDGVNVIFGCYMSSARKEVLPVVERRNGLLFYPTLYEGFEYSANCIYGGAAPNQNSVPLASYLMENFGKRFFFVGSDYIYPRESNRVMRNIVRQGRGEVVGEHYLPLDAEAAEFEPIVQEILRTKPDVIFSTVVGSGTIHFYQVYKAAGADPTRVPIGSLTTNEAEVAEMGADVACGHITAAPYFRNLDNPENRTFLQRYEKRFGSTTHVTSGCEAAYDQAHMFARALAEVGSTDTERLRGALVGAEFQAPQGLIRIDPDNNHTYLHSRIARVNAEGEFEVVRAVARAIKPDPYLVFPALNDWSMWLQASGSS